MRLREKEREFGRRREEATIGGGGCDELALPIWACFKERPQLVGINAVFMKNTLEKFHAHTSVGSNWIMGCF